MVKLRLLIDLASRSLKQFGMYKENVFIDEQVITYFGHIFHTTDACTTVKRPLYGPFLVISKSGTNILGCNKVQSESNKQNLCVQDL